MRPTKRQQQIAQNLGAGSPPGTPATASSVSAQQDNITSPEPSPARDRVYPTPMSHSSNRFGPLAEEPNTHNSRRPNVGGQHSTRSLSESESEEDTDSDDDESITSEIGEAPSPPSPYVLRATTTTVATFIIDDMGTFESGDEDRINALLPHTIDECPDSPLGLSLRTQTDQTFMYQFPRLDSSDEESSHAAESSDELEADNEFEEEMMRRRQARRVRRMTAGSIGKRTITESIGSDSDMEDHRSQIPFFLDPSEAGSSARRLRRKVGNRTSLLFHDPPMPRIDQMDEPATSDDEFLDDDALKELPYFSLEYITMEVDSP